MEGKKQEIETANDEEGKGTRGSSSQKRGEQRGHIAKEEFLGLKLRRGIAAAGRKSGGGSHTPVPTWKMEPDDDLVVGGGGGGGGEEGVVGADQVGPSSDKGRRSSVSARQLGASLWEIQSLAPRNKNGRRGSVSGAHRQRHGKGVEDEDGADDEIRSCASLRQHRTGSLLEKHRVRERGSRAPLPGSPASYCSSIGAAAVNHAMTPSCSSEIIKMTHREGRHNLKTSTELLKVLNRIWTLEEQQESHVSIIKSLKTELQQAHMRVKELEGLFKHVSDEKLVKKSREKEKLKEAVQSLQVELLEERRVRKHSEHLHKKLGKDLNELKGAFLKAVKDLDKEKRANSLLEDLCDEFAKGIRDYEEEVRLLKQGNDYKDESHKFDRLILQVAEAWLDERMQLQMAEARGDLVEKTAIVERLSGEFKSFLHSRLAPNKVDNNRNGNFRRQSLESVHLNGTSAPRVAEEDDSDSVASDLHCFELDMRANGKPSNSRTKLDSNRENITNVKEIKSPDMGMQFCASDPPQRQSVQRKLSYLEDACKSNSCEIVEVEGNLHRNFERSAEPSRLTRVNTLKAKLMEARLEGRQARLKASSDVVLAGMK
ncbi:intracellular protein transporter USO1-like protein [Rhynchospora pubera]|uniref:Intracellular protein transporter USO1-like protein n=1 Tax=Rhynchospora pubera TaxID=906938 RepID=A0AAV8DTW5_9POAL|nr:intracellular protein transporter USO1-like protein [Rhynchospora pubera]